MKLGKLGSATVGVLLLGLAATSALFAQDNSRHTIPNSKFGLAATAKDLGLEQTTKQITIYVWLQLHNADALQELVEQQYDPSSANYQNWLTADQFSSTYAPLPEEVATVKGFLGAHNLSVLSVGERNMYVKAQGSIADIQAAFNVEIHQFDVRGQTYRGNSTDPVMEGPAGALVSRVGGLSNFHMQPHIMRHVNPSTGKPFAAQAISAAPDGAIFSPYCLQGIATENFSTDGSTPKATYFGNVYGAPLTNTNLGTLAPCGYQPSDLQTAYGLKALYNIGLTGSNQNVVIVDPYGSPTIGTDASFYSSYYGLPPLDLTVVPLGLSCAASAGTNPALCQDAAYETSLDVESAHAVAPGANIVLIEAASLYNDDLNAAILYAVDNELGNVISNSYGAPESQEGIPSNDPFGATLLVAAAQGIAVNFSSGDYGDFSPIEGYTDVSYPASSPYATAVGGTSLFLNQNKTMAFQTGWGNNFTAISNPTDVNGYSTPLVPPDSSPYDGLGFAGGSGGGRSGVFSKPSFQKSLPGRVRLVPDISYLADPHTGIEIFCTGASCFDDGSNGIELGLVGGTSLACPMFSALWAIANQRAGHPLGQAARSIYRLPSNAITDVGPFSSAFDVTGSITVGNRTTHENPLQLVMPETKTPFLSALFDGGDGFWFVISFGTDSSLSTSWGWDDVTGLGTPNGLDFVKAVAPIP